MRLATGKGGDGLGGGAVQQKAMPREDHADEDNSPRTGGGPTSFSAVRSAIPDRTASHAHAKATISRRMISISHSVATTWAG